MKLLIVEDDAAIRESVTDVLTEEGFAVKVTDSVEAALDYLSHAALPSGILLDLMMKNMDGRHLLATLKSDPFFEKIPIIIMTAARVFDVPGAAMILRKPFTVRELLNAIEKHCTHPAS